MSKKIIAATHNKGKLREFSRMLEHKEIEIISPPEGIMETIVENGTTFAENALIKARTVFEATGIPTMADDSGLCVDALGGDPGVKSARFMGEDTSYTVKNAAIIDMLKDVPDDKRTARFECAIAVVSEKGERVFLGTFEGKIGYEAKGDNGFGYDPIFYVGDVSSSEMSAEEKDSMSHRGKALRAMIGGIDDLV